jgi:hypothetical protein
VGLINQTVQDMATLLHAPPGWDEIYSRSYTNVFDEPPSVFVTVDAVDFYGVDINGNVMGPDWARSWAPTADSWVGAALRSAGSVLYGTKVFHLSGNVISLPIIGNISVDKYRYSFAHRHF